jgi:hypothetical protein
MPVCFVDNFQIDTELKKNAANVFIATTSSIPSPKRSLQVIDLFLKHHELALSCPNPKSVDLDCGRSLNLFAEFGRVGKHSLPWPLALESTLFDIVSFHCNLQSTFQFFVVSFLNFCL